MSSDARTLRSLIDEGRRFDPEHAVHIIIEACKAFARENALGVISPMRILVSDDGSVSLNSAVTKGAVQATFGYVAPENVPTMASRTPSAVMSRSLLNLL